MRLLRVNPLDTEWGPDDLEAARGLPIDGLVLPKTTPGSIEPWAMLGIPLLVLVETAAGLRASYEIASHPAVAALILGGADLSVELRLQPRRDGLELLHARSRLVLDSAAAGIRPPFDIVHLDIHDAAELERECELGKSLGFGGKMCIHPAQLEVVNRVFSPSEQELAEARAVVEAFEAGHPRRPRRRGPRRPDDRRAGGRRGPGDARPPRRRADAATAWAPCARPRR